MEGRCAGLTLSGHKCKNKIKDGSDKCHMHGADNQCAVCFTGLIRNTRKLPCGHEFHQRCIDRWKRSCRADPTCPMCRVPFDLPTYRVTITIQRVADDVYESSEILTSNVQGMQAEFGLDMRVLDLHADSAMNILFDIEEHEDLREVLRALGVGSSVGVSPSADSPTTHGIR
jgi:hypothetical protein